MKKCIQTTLYAGLFVSCACNAFAEAAASIPAWFVVGHIELRVSDPSRALTAAWVFDRADNGDVRVLKKEVWGQAQVAGTVLSICGDRALLLKDIAPVSDDVALNEIDTPVLGLQLALKLLALALPQGPQSMAAADTIEIHDDGHALHTHKPGSLPRDFEALWRATVHAQPLDGGIEFEIAFSQDAGGGSGGDITLAGIWRQDSAMPFARDDMRLGEWRVYRIDMNAATERGRTEIVSHALRQAVSPATLADVRAYIERGWATDPRAHKLLACTG